MEGWLVFTVRIERAADHRQRFATDYEQTQRVPVNQLNLRSLGG